jgi:hypothetical protein
MKTLGKHLGLHVSNWNVKNSCSLSMWRSWTFQSWMWHYGFNKWKIKVFQPMKVPNWNNGFFNKVRMGGVKRVGGEERARKCGEVNVGWPRSTW